MIIPWKDLLHLSAHRFFASPTILLVHFLLILHRRDVVTAILYGGFNILKIIQVQLMQIVTLMMKVDKAFDVFFTSKISADCSLYSKIKYSYYTKF